MYEQNETYLPVFEGTTFIGVAPKHIEPEKVIDEIYLECSQKDFDLKNYTVALEWKKFEWKEYMYPFVNPDKPSVEGDVLEMYVYSLMEKGEN